MSQVSDNIAYYRDLLVRAREAEHGLAIPTSDPDMLRRDFYVAKRELAASGEPFDELMFRIGPDADKKELWIIKKEEA